jgi:iron complex outermembrane receptor protein
MNFCFSRVFRCHTYLVSSFFILILLACSFPVLADGQVAVKATGQDTAPLEVTQLAQADQAEPDQAAGEDAKVEEVVVVGSQIRGAAISEALAVSVVDAGEIETFGISSGDELLDYLPEQGQNFFNAAEEFSGGVNAARGDIGAFNLRNMGTGNTLVLLNGRRVVQAAGYQTEQVGGSFVPVNTANATSIPVYGVQRIEVLRDGASAIYGADAVAGVLNTVLKKDFEGFSVRARYDDYDNIPRNDQRISVEWGRFFNNGRTNVGLSFDAYHRDRVHSSDDPRWADEDYRRYVVGTPWEGLSSWNNQSTNSFYPQLDFRSGASGLGVRHLTDSAGEFETYPIGDPRCEGGWVINENVCAHADGQGTYRYNRNDNRELLADLDRYNLFLYVNHQMDNGVEAFTELSWYQADTNSFAEPAQASSGAADLQLGPENYYNPFGPCDSPNRLPAEIIGDDVPCSGTRLEIDNYRFLEAPRINDTDNQTWRFLQGFRGTKGEWDWETALVWSEAERTNITHNRVSNTLIQEALDDPTPAAYNLFTGNGDSDAIQRALVDVYRKNTTDLHMIDFKLTNNGLFEMPAGPVGFLAGIEYREESFVDDRDPRLDGTIVFTSYEGATYPIVSDVAQSSPTADSRGSRDVTSLFTEFAIPVFDTLDVQLAARYEDFSDVGSTTVGKFAFGWRPIDSLLFRGSWSEAFRAPNLITINEELVVRSNTRDDYVCLYVEEVQDVDLDCSSSTQRRARGSKDLVPEKSTNTSFGLVWDATESLTFTLDYWAIEKEDTIGLFGEENHTILDLLYRLQGGTANCDTAVFNPVIGRDEPDEAEIPLYLASGVCPVGEMTYVEDTYANLDTRTIEGHDIGIYYDRDTRFGTFSFKYVGTFYDKYEQVPGGFAKVLVNAVASGDLPSNTPVQGFADLLNVEGNADEKHSASLRWARDAWGASVSMWRLGSFSDPDQTRPDGTLWILPSMTTYNTTVDYRFDMFGTDSRIRLGINNVTDERAPLCDCRFGYWSDAHRDFGRSWYVDLNMKFD